MKNKNYVEFNEIYSKVILDELDPRRKYPRWEKRLIKRKYGKYPAVYLDVYMPYMPGLFDIIPKALWKGFK